MANARLNIIITAIDKASGAFKNIGKGFERLKRSAKIAGIAAAGFVTAIGVSAIKAAANFEESLSNINTLFDDNGESVKQLEKGIKSLLKRVPKSADDLGASAYQIVSAGISDTSEALQVLEASTKLAVAGLGETSQATDIVTSAINAFGLDASNAQRVANTFFLAVKSGKTTVSELAQGFGQVAPLASAVGVEFEELAALTSALTVSGLKASIAYSQQRAVLSNLLKPTAEMQQLFDKLNITNIKSQIENEGLVDTIVNLANATDGNNQMLAKAFGSVEALNVVLALLNGTAELTEDIMDGMANNANAVNIAFDKQNKTTKAQFMILKNNLNVVMIDLGVVILPKLISGMKILNEEIIPGLNILWTEWSTRIKQTLINLERLITTMKAYARAAADIASLGALPLFRATKPIREAVGGAISSVVGLANGGVVTRPTAAIIGESGPEAIIPLNKAGKFGGVTINITGTFLSETVAEEVGDMIMERLKGNIRLTA